MFLGESLYKSTKADADIGRLKYLQLHKLFDNYLDRMLVKFEQNHMVRTTQNTQFSKKWLTIEAILDDVSVTITIIGSGY